MPRVRSKCLRMPARVPQRCGFLDVTQPCCILLASGWVTDQLSKRLQCSGYIGKLKSCARGAAGRFDYRMEYDPRFLRCVEKARKSTRAGRGIGLEDPGAVLSNC